MTGGGFEAGVVDSYFRSRKKTYTGLVYQPMLELLAYLRVNGFKTYICFGGGVEFMRAYTEKVYGIGPEYVIGSFSRNVFINEDGEWQMVKTVDFYHDRW